MAPSTEKSTFYTQAIQVFLVSLSLMMFEINLIRIFSVMMKYHLAFFVLAIALFGFGIGGLYAQLVRRKQSAGVAPGPFHAYLPLLLALSIITALLLLSILPLNSDSSTYQVPRMRWILLTFLMAAAPFFIGSLFMAQIFASRPSDAGKLYSFDLVGAGLGCLVILPALGTLGGMTTPFLVAAVATVPALIGSAAFFRRKMLAGAMLLLSFALLGANVKYDFINALARVAWDWQTGSFWGGNASTQGRDLLFSKWNFYSRVGVSERPNFKGWRLSPNYEGPTPDHLMITHDNRAPAFIVNYDGDPEKVEYLKYDLTSLPFHIKDADSALIIGAGGGKDLLTAKLFNVPKIVGIELNPITVNDVMRGAFREYSGNIYGQEGVEVVLDSGRTFAYTDDGAYDLVLVSFADNQVANNQGASVMAENHLYTKEAFQSYWHRLSPTGICGMAGSAFWSDHLLVRLTNTMRAVLEEEGVDSPENHLIAIRTPKGNTSTHGMYVAISKQPVDDTLKQRLQETCDKLAYELLWPAPPDAPPLSADLASLFVPEQRENFLKAFEPDAGVLVDDRPYISFGIKPRTFFNALLRPFQMSDSIPLHFQVLHLMLDFFAVILGCVICLMLAPLIFFKRGDLQHNRKTRFMFLSVFFFLGIAYVLIEIALLQHFFLLLGDPALTFAVMLAAMLIFTGVGSLISQRFPEQTLGKNIGVVAAIVAVMLSAIAVLMPGMVTLLLSTSLPVKILAVFGLLMVMATPMGMMFPSAIRLMERHELNMTCWAWGMNGIGSVLGSVGATVLSMNFGIHTVFAVGIGCYFAVLFTSWSLKASSP